MELGILAFATLCLDEKALCSVNDANGGKTVAGNAIGYFFLLLDASQTKVLFTILGKNAWRVGLLLNEQVELNGCLRQVIVDAFSSLARLHLRCLLLCHCYDAT